MSTAFAQPSSPPQKKKKKARRTTVTEPYFKRRSNGPTVRRDYGNQQATISSDYEPSGLLVCDSLSLSYAPWIVLWSHFGIAPRSLGWPTLGPTFAQARKELERIIAGPEDRAVVQARDSDMPHGSCSGSNAASESGINKSSSDPSCFNKVCNSLTLV